MASIYILKFPDDSVYVGQTSGVLRTRYLAHLSQLKGSRHCNKKMQSKYDQFGAPELILVEEIHYSKLNEQEIYWIKEFDSYYNGLNLTPGGDCAGFGENANAALYHPDDYLAVVMFLGSTELTPVEVSKEVEINVDIVYTIVAGTTHSYIADILPKEYAIMMARRDAGWKRTRTSKTFPLLRYLDGTVVEIKNVEVFSIENNIDPSSLYKLLAGKVEFVRGYVLASLPRRYIKNIATEEIAEVPYGPRTSLYSKYGFGDSGLSQLLNGKLKTYKGWRLYDKP